MMKLFLFCIPFICISCAAYMQSAAVVFKHKLVAHENSLLDKFKHYRRHLPTYLKATRKTTVRKAREFQNGMPITSALIFTNVVLYALTKGIPGLGWIPLFKGNPRLLQKLIKIDAAVDRGQVYRLFTSCFCHGSLMHLFSNCMSLSSIGPEMERLFGPLRFLVVYVGSGVLADVGTYLLRSSPYSLGASGCVFGLVGAMAAFYYSNRAVLGRRSAIGLESIKRTMVINLLYGLSAGNVDNMAHIGGAICGGVLSLLLGPRLFYGGYRFGRTRLVDKPLVPLERWLRRWLEGVRAGSGADDAIPALPSFRRVWRGQQGSDGDASFYPKRPSMR